MRILQAEVFQHPHLLDGSQLHRPEAKDVDDFRRYKDENLSPWEKNVLNTYMEMHTNQTVNFVRRKIQKWTRFNHVEATVMEALHKLNDLVDESDVDIDLPNIHHAFQTAEKIREMHPDKDWLQLTGLIHDLGKLMAFYDEPQWGVVGDTWPVGCKPQPSVVYSDRTFKNNPDMTDRRYNSTYGIYEPNCGFRNLLMSWGHDEYLYRVLVENKTTLPHEALYIIKFHSFYPWHTGNDYDFLADDYDRKMLPWLRLFNKYDLYTKSNKTLDVEALTPYYQSLVDKYLPGIVRF